MKFNSVFDIIGPIMIGPSSSHTAGAARIGRIARKLFEREPKWAKIQLYGSFAQTHKGHGTDEALVGGILDFDTDNPSIIESLAIAEQKNIAIEIIEEETFVRHPNTARVTLGDENGQVEIVGISIGGGKVEIIEVDGFSLKITGDSIVLLVLHHDRFGLIARVSNVLAENQINIGQMDVSRKEKGKVSLMTIEVDQDVTAGVMDQIRKITHVLGVTKILE